MVDVVVVGGAEASITPGWIASFGRAGALSKNNADPKHASRPFDARRDGFVMSEGAGALILERRELAEERGAPILATLAGYGATSDAFHMTQPHPEGEGATAAMRMALESAGVTPEEIDYVSAHGTSTPYNDRSETVAIKDALGPEAKRVAISSIKGHLGHSLGAAGAFEAVATVMAIQRGMIPPTINYVEPDPDCDLDYVPEGARKAEIRAALSNSFGFGGHNGCIVFKKTV
jgi:3-oxoacyl-[acyl-carrier-protein] synthase II